MSVNKHDIREETYKLPTDLKEMDRLALQHRMWYLMIGGLYPTGIAQKVEARLRPVDGRQPTVLDVGCGSGIWGKDVAKAFPNARVIGLDLVEQNQSNAPDNFLFIQGDISAGIPQFRNQADVIHCRCVAQHVTDPQGLILTLSKCLRPGGLLLIADGDWIVYDRTMKLLEPFKFDLNADWRQQVRNAGSRSWYAGWLDLFGNLTRSKSYRPIDELIKASATLRLMESRDFLSPINWSGESIERGKELGEVLNANQRNFFHSAKSIALRTGLPQEVLDIWERHYEDELDHNQYYNVWHYASAQKL